MQKVSRREGGLITIEIAVEDRPRRCRAHRPLSSGRTVAPITKEWVVLIPRLSLGLGAPVSMKSVAQSYSWKRPRVAVVLRGSAPDNH